MTRSTRNSRRTTIKEKVVHITTHNAIQVRRPFIIPTEFLRLWFATLLSPVSYFWRAPLSYRTRFIARPFLFSCQVPLVVGHLGFFKFPRYLLFIPPYFCADTLSCELGLREHVTSFLRALEKVTFGCWLSGLLIIYKFVYKEMHTTRLTSYLWDVHDVSECSYVIFGHNRQPIWWRNRHYENCGFKAGILIAS